MTALVRVVLGRIGRHDAVAVEMGLGKELLGDRAVSSRVMAAASGFLRLPRICLAEASNCLPSGVASLMALSGSSGRRLEQVVGILQATAAHLAAAMSSGARMRPSLSVSISASVLASNSRPVVGQARATQSFWSELIQGHQVGPGLQPDLVEAAGAKEFPSVVCAS